LVVVVVVVSYKLLQGIYP